MIFLDLVGGGGSAKSSLVMIGPPGRLRDKSAGELGDTGRYEESEPLAEDVDELVLALSSSWKAVGGRLNAGAALLPSFPRMSDDEPGVGGRFGRGIVLPAPTGDKPSSGGRRA